MIEISDLRFGYEQSAFRLCVPELDVSPGAKVAIIGPSGSGKTTLLSLIAGILVPDAGSVVANGVEVSALAAAARRRFRVSNIGLVFQEFELLEHLDALDNILLPCRIASSISLTGERRRRAVELSREMGIDDKLHQHVRTMSQGERQRVALCRALLLEPAILLCDEPTGNLDPSNKEHVLNMLFQYVDRTNTTLVTVTHDHELVPRFDDVIDFKCFQQVDIANG